MSPIAVVFKKEMREILRDRRTLMAIGLAALATPIVLFVISQVSTKTASQAYTVGYSGTVPTGLDTLFNAVGLKLELVDDPAKAAKQQVDIGVAFTPSGVEEFYDPTRQSAQLADVRFQTVLSRYDAAKVAASLQEKGVDPSVLTPPRRLRNESGAERQHPWPCPSVNTAASPPSRHGALQSQG